MINELKEMFLNNEIEEIYTVGFVEIDSGIAEYFPDDTVMFFQVGGKFIKFETVENYWRLKVEIVNEIQYTEDLFEDVIPAKTKVGDIILASGTDSLGHNIVDKIYIYNLVDKESNICDALEICLKNGQCIFIDPRFLGVKIGDEIQKRIWFDNYGNEVIVNMISICD